MRAVRSNHPPGLVGIITADLARYPEFYWCLEKLLVPEGSTYKTVMGNGLSANRNLILNELPEQAEWVWYIDDDHEFHPDIVMRLLDRNVDIVQPMCATRKPPYMPYVYKRNPDYNGYDYITPPWNELPLSGIHEYDAVGTGGMLIRRPVLDALGYPWFEEGKTQRDVPGEDLYFCSKAKEAGFRVWKDMDTKMGHIGKHTVWPSIHPNGQEWLVDLDLRHGVVVGVPQQAWAETQYEEITAKS